MEQLFEEYSFEETLVEVAWIQESMALSGSICVEDSWDAKCAVFIIAKEITDSHLTYKLKGDYYEYIYNYAIERLAAMFPYR